MRKVKRILTKLEMSRVRQVLKKEFTKPKNKEKYLASLLGLIEDLENYSGHRWYLDIVRFMKNYKTKMDGNIKRKLKKEYGERKIDVEKFRKTIKQSFHKYTAKDYGDFLKKSEYFFSLYKHPFTQIKLRKKEYLNRTYLGLGFEFLLKAIFLKKGFLINELKSELLEKEGIPKPIHPVKLGKVKKRYLKANVNELNYFIEQLTKIKPKKVDIRDFDECITFGLLIVQVWRNQDLHIPTKWFSMNGGDVINIKLAYKSLYRLYLKKEKMPQIDL